MRRDAIATGASRRTVIAQVHLRYLFAVSLTRNARRATPHWSAAAGPLQNEHYAPMPRYWSTFLIALLVEMSTFVVGGVMSAVGKRSDPIWIVAGLAFTFGGGAFLWFCARRGHAWPRWALLAVSVLGFAGSIAPLSARSLVLVPLDAVAVTLLIWGWPRQGVSAEL